MHVIFFLSASDSGVSEPKTRDLHATWGVQSFLQILQDIFNLL